MGTTYHILYIGNSNEDNSQELKTAVDKNLLALNGVMSTYIPNSELSIFNHSKSLEWQPISKSLSKVVGHALEVGKMSGGAFDPTIGPLVNLWGFGPKGKREIPSKEDITKALENVGLEKIELNSSKLLWKKKTRDVYVDLSALAKGFGVDEVAGLLESKGIENYMVEIGGEVKTKGSKKSGPWVIAIESPSIKEGAGSYHKILQLNSKALATSGNYRNFFKQNNKHYSHTINFKTGRPVAHTLASVSVADNEACMNADAWATALMSLGLDKGFELARKLKIPAYFIYKLDSSNDFDVKETEEFTKLTK